MPSPHQNLSPAQLAMQMRARRTKRMLIWNLGLFVIVIALAAAVWGSYAGWFNVKSPGAEGNRSTANTSTNAGGSSETTKYPVRKFAVICDLSGHAQPRLSKFLPGAMSQFNAKQLVDMIVLSGEGGFVSQTNGLAAMSSDAKSTACDAVYKSRTPSNASALGAIQHAADEQVEAVYLLTTPPRVQEFGADPMVTLGKITKGQKLTVNCILFVDGTDSPADLATFKLLADGTHGTFLPVVK